MQRQLHSETPSFKRHTIGRYDIIYPLASGGMAAVYVGRLSGMAGFEKLVTLKIIHSHLAAERQFIEMFLDEARLAARIHHPNVGEIYEIIEDHGQLIIAAEFIDGFSLRHLLRESRERRISISRPIAAWICAEVCQGLQVVHALTDDDGHPLNLVHRDISPSNILLSYNGWVKLIDFGIAFAENRLAHTIPGNLKGKIGYISPEQLKGESLDCRADIFSLGVILYQLVTGRHPFPGNSDAERLRKTLDDEIVLPSRILPIEDTLETIILRALAKSPSDRYQNAATLGRDLRHYIARIREITGASDVAHLMNTLFASQKALHQERIFEFKQSTPAPPHGYQLSEVSYSSSRTGADDSEVVERKHRFSIRELVLFVVIGGVVASLFTAGIFRLLSPDVGSLPRHDDIEAVVGDMKDVSEIIDTHGVGLRATEKSPSKSGENKARVIAIAVEVQPIETKLLLNGKELNVEGNLIELPEEGAVYDIVAQAPGYFSETHRIVAKEGERLVIELSPTPERSPETKKHQKSRGRKSTVNQGSKKSTRVLKRNPYL